MATLSSNPEDNLIRIGRTDYRVVLDKALQGRSEYLDQTKVSTSESLIRNRKPMFIMMNDVKEPMSMRQYEVITHGVTPCGSKCTVIIKNIHPSVDIEWDRELTEMENTNRIRGILKCLERKVKSMRTNSRGLEIKLIEKTERVHGRRIIGFTEDVSTFSRVYFNTQKHRIAFIDMLTEMDIPSYNNDRSSYYRVVARTRKLNLSGWNVISDYNIVHTGEYRSRFVFEVDIDNINGYNEGDDITPWEVDDIRSDHMVSMCWDIEQFSSDFDVNRPNKPSRIPDGNVMDDTIFNIGMTFQFVNEANSFLNLSLICKEAKPFDDYITVVCDNEKTLLLAWAYIIKLMQPDFIVEFNGSSFDWPNLVDKCMLYNILPDVADFVSIKRLADWEKNQDKLRQYSYRTDTIKLAADRNQKIANLQMHGYVAIDLRIILMQLNPTESKSSLKFYLDMYGLTGKDDMPIPLLFTYFVNGDVDKLGDVAHYCYIDCFRLHQLLHKINLIQDRRAVGLLSFTSVFDTFYRANGCKVRNIIAANAYDLNLFCNTVPKKVSEEDTENGQYPGALVLKPRRGLVRPTMNFKEFCKHRLEVHDAEIIEHGQRVIAAEYDAFFKNLSINSIGDVEAILKTMGLDG